MDEYKTEYRKVEIRRCEKHPDQVFTVACKKCYEVVCSTCIVLRPEVCYDGKWG